MGGFERAFSDQEQIGKGQTNRLPTFMGGRCNGNADNDALHRLGTFGVLELKPRPKNEGLS
jgi:hypothetical protein